MPSRSVPEGPLAWPACTNARDLGGHPTLHGAMTRTRAIVRADSPGHLTDRGCDALEAYGIRTIIDLRFPVEVRDDPSPFADHATITTHTFPLNPNDPRVSRATAAFRESALPYMARVNAAYLAAEATTIAAIMRAIAAAPVGGVLVHCSAGRDRTGLIAALLLALARVPPAVIVADYARSVTALPATMEETLAHLDAVYGGAARYLRAAAVTAGELASLRRRLSGGCPSTIRAQPAPHDQGLARSGSRDTDSSPRDGTGFPPA